MGLSVGLSSMARYPGVPEALDRIIFLARDKIIGGTNFNLWKKNRDIDTIAETLSILDPRLCIDVSP